VQITAQQLTSQFFLVLANKIVIKIDEMLLWGMVCNNKTVCNKVLHTCTCTVSRMATLCNKDMLTWGKYFKNPLRKNHPAKNAETYMKAIWHSTKAEFLKIMAPGVGRGYNRGNCFYMCVYRKIHLLRNHEISKAEIYMKAFRHSTSASLLRSWPLGVGSPGLRQGELFLHVLI
jgi:hypothetical protein